MNLRKTLIVNKKLQLSLIMTFLIYGLILLCLHLGYVSYILDGLAQINSEVQSENLRYLVKIGSVVALSIGAVIVIIVLWLGLYLTNKIAGPIYSICRQLKEIKETGKFNEIKVREGDYFEELVIVLNETLRDRY